MRAVCDYMDSQGFERVFSAVTPELVRSYMSWMLHEKKVGGT